MVDRSLLPAGAVTRFAWAIPIEFAVVHASGFLAMPWVARWDARRRAIYVPALAGLYTLPLAIIAFAVHGWWPLTIFWGLMLNRMLVVVFGDLPDDNAFTAWAMAWAGTTTLYVLSIIAGVFVARTDVARALIIGFVYFTMVGLSELTGWAWVHRWMTRAREREAKQARSR